VVEDGRVLGIDERRLLAEAQREAERLWASVPEWDWRHRTTEEFSPPSLPPLETDLHGGPEMAPKPPTLGAPRETRGAPRT
jgi:hypothetical protein